MQVGHDPWNPDWFICFGDPFIMAIYHKEQPFVGNLTHFPWIRHGIWTKRYLEMSWVQEIFWTSTLLERNIPGLCFQIPPKKGPFQKQRVVFQSHHFFERSASFRGCSFLVGGWNEQICLSIWIVFPNRLDFFACWENEFHDTNTNTHTNHTDCQN